MDLTAARLRALFRYDQMSGEFFFLTRAARRVRIGDHAGSINSEGYRSVTVDGRQYKAHRLAWLYVRGAWPEHQIDHINGGRDDNRFVNLRKATRSQNLANSKAMRRGKALPKGVSFNRQSGRWIARIQCAGRSRFLGYFDNPEAAATAYATSATETFGPYARVS